MSAQLLAALAALALAVAAPARAELPAPVAVTCEAVEAPARLPEEPAAFGAPALAEELPADRDGLEPGLDAPDEPAGQAEPATVSLSIGSPDAGLLVNPVAMPEGPFWVIRNPVETYGTAETILYLQRAIEAVQLQFPDSPPLVVGDISRADGGRLNRHKSHQSGRDVDLGLFYRDGAAADFRPADARNLDVARTWALVKALAAETDVEHVFLDRSIQRLLQAHARELGESAWFDELTGRAGVGRDAILQHERRHRDHLHVRFYNPQAQECARRQHRDLVARGVLPPPVVRHRVRSGETLGTLSRRYGVSAASIRRANGMRSSFLRAGQSLAIPTRRLPVEEAPLLVPPRLLPPVATSTPTRQETGAAGFGGGQR